MGLNAWKIQIKSVLVAKNQSIRSGVVVKYQDWEKSFVNKQIKTKKSNILFCEVTV